MAVTEPSEASTVPVDALTIAAGEDVRAVAPAPTRKQAELADKLDSLSLTQALIDFELANARTRDLTQRLVGLVEENTRLEGELAEVTAELAAERELWAEVK